MNWSSYDAQLQVDADSPEEQWETSIDSHRLGGLSQNYAHQFLDAAVVLYRQEEKTNHAAMIEKYSEAILQASKDTAQDGLDSFHPFYLDLCLEMIEKQGAHFDPATHLGKTPKDLMQRFLKYLDDDGREWHWAFALASEFDEELFEHLLDAKSISGNLQEFYRFVFAYSYITPQHDSESYRFHRLMQASLIADIASKDQTTHIALRKSIVDKLIAFYDEKFTDRAFESLAPKGAEYYERANDMLVASVKAQLISVEDAYAKSDVWDKPFAPAFFKLREGVQRSWLEITKDLLGDKHPLLATNLDNLAIILQSQGKYVEAESLFRETLAMRQDILGNQHPDVATNMNSLGSILELQGNYPEAEKMYREALAMRQDVLGNQHPAVATSLGSLANVLGRQGNYFEAEKMHRDALAMKRKLLGDEHPNVATSLHNLATVLILQGNYPEAEKVYREALAMHRDILGNQHPHVATNMNSLANVLRLQGNDSESEKMYREALAMRQDILGDQHLDVAKSLSGLASVLEQQGNYPEAEKVYREALVMLQDILGNQHPDAVTSLHNLATALARQGNYSEAEKMHQEALTMRRKRLGDEHPDVAKSLLVLAVTLLLQGEHRKVEHSLREAYTILLVNFDEQHVEVIACKKMLDAVVQKVQADENEGI